MALGLHPEVHLHKYGRIFQIIYALLGHEIIHLENHLRMRSRRSFLTGLHEYFQLPLKEEDFDIL